ncbi:MAG: agmatinase [Methermicoccaceae archaeon]
MYIQPFFADADTPYDDSDFVIFGVPFDATSSFRPGSRFAPDAMRQASYTLETYNRHFDADMDEIKVCDEGNLDVGSSVSQMIKEVKEKVGIYLSDGKVPIMMGGEHSTTLGAVMACMEYFDDLCFLVLDAHLDLRDSFEDVKYSHASVSHHILNVLSPQRYASIGVRSGTREEYSRVAKDGLTSISAETIQKEGVDGVIHEVMTKFDDMGCKNIYLSVDADVIDPAFAPAVSTPEPFGIFPTDVLHIIRSFSEKLVALDVVEVCPGYDHGETAILFSKLIREFIFAKAHCEVI